MYLSCNTLLQGGKYKIVSFISSGGFGNTYEAFDVDHNKKVAVKEFFMKDSCNREETTNRVIVATKAKEEQVTRMKEKFMKEARALQNMSHPNIVHVENAFEENATAYYVMDYIEGTSLNDIIKVAGSLSEEKALDYIIQIADALSYVHSKNILHLDVKPGNIMVDKNGRAVLIDFGASKQYDEVTGENTSTLLGINTTGYAPAEQSYRGFVQFAPSTDIYALGTTLYKLLTGITPPDAQMLKDGEVELVPLPSNISESVKNAIREAMRPLRKDRPQSVEEFVVLLNGDGKTSTQKKNTEKAVYAKGSVNHNGKSDNESTLIDLDDKFSRDVKELCVQTGKSQAECDKALKQTKGNKQAALIKILTDDLHQRCGRTDLGIGRKTCKKHIESADRSLNKAEKSIKSLIKEREDDIESLFSIYSSNFDKETCKEVYAKSNYNKKLAEKKLEEKIWYLEHITVSESEGNFITRYLSEKWTLITQNVFSSIFYLIVFMGSLVLGMYTVGLLGAWFVPTVLEGALACVLGCITKWLFDEDLGFVKVSYFVYEFLCMVGIISFVILACVKLFSF